MESVKREYRSSLRADQAAQTRRTIVATAADLFVTHGYAGTTIDAVAAAAGVSRKTVFSAAGGKLELLKTAVDWALAGDDRAVALAQRDPFRTLPAEDDAGRLIAGWADALVDIDIRVARLFRAVEVAAESDASARELLVRYQRQRLSGARVIADRLTELGALRVELTRAEAVDIAWLASDPTLFDRMVLGRGWSHRRFRSWLTDFLCGQLLRPTG